MVAWLAARFAGWGTKLAVGAAFVGLVLLGALRLIGIGRQAERTDATEKGVDAIKRANRAAQNVDHRAEAIANDPNNLDR
jgi:hypothetical protein